MRSTNVRDTKTTGILNGVAAGVFLTGAITVASILLEQTRFRHAQVVAADAHITVLVGLSFIYLATLLRRGKRNAWLLAVPLYSYIVVRNVRHFAVDLPTNKRHFLEILLNLVIPILALCALLVYHKLFRVRSELRNLSRAGKRAILVLLVAFLYGVVGFQLLDQHDFHQEISLPAGAHYTVDQFGLTTNKQVIPHTKRAHLFLDSLGAISLGSVFYVCASLFAPIRFRLGNQHREQEVMRDLLQKYPGSSEDFFKLWPHDKAYFFNENYSAGLAYRVSASVALVVSDPAGNPAEFKGLLSNFIEYCQINDWSAALIHTDQKYIPLYKEFGFDIQKIGEEALVDIDHFCGSVATNKYFRNIKNRFESKGYHTEILLPPHNEAVIRRLREVSRDWLKRGNRTERGFMMGYFSEDYMQTCPIMVVRDGANTIQAFINQLVTTNKHEANFDLLRHTQTSLGNINDFLMMNFIEYLSSENYKQLNMGLAPLAGLSPEDKANRGVIDSILGFIYESTSRFYSFQGLKRFKAKYEPAWESRFIVYQDSVPGLTKTLTAQLRAMRIHRKLLH